MTRGPGPPAPRKKHHRSASGPPATRGPGPAGCGAYWCSWVVPPDPAPPRQRVGSAADRDAPGGQLRSSRPPSARPQPRSRALRPTSSSRPPGRRPQPRSRCFRPPDDRGSRTVHNGTTPTHDIHNNVVKRATKIHETHNGLLVEHDRFQGRHHFPADHWPVVRNEHQRRSTPVYRDRQLRVPSQLLSRAGTP